MLDSNKIGIFLVNHIVPLQSTVEVRLVVKSHNSHWKYSNTIPWAGWKTVKGLIVCIVTRGRKKKCCVIFLYVNESCDNKKIEALE